MDTTFYHVSERTIERIAEVAASKVPGCRAIDAKLAGLAGRSFPRIDARLDQHSGTATIDAEIASTYPAPIAAITDAVRATIIAHVRELAGVEVARVHVGVANVESLGPGTRVTWDEVARHDAHAVPEPIEVRPTKVVHPVTQTMEELTHINVHSLVSDMRAVVVPAPPEIVHPEQPQPVDVESIDTPAAVEPVSPHVPAPRPLMPVHTYPTEARVPFPPAPVQPWTPSISPTEAWSPRATPPVPWTPKVTPQTVRHPQVSALAPLQPVRVNGPVRPEPVSLPRRQPLREVTVNRPPARPVEILSEWKPRRVAAPQPDPVIVPTAPAPKPLKQITIIPVVKYYDRTR